MRSEWGSEWGSESRGILMALTGVKCASETVDVQVQVREADQAQTLLIARALWLRGTGHLGGGGVPVDTLLDVLGELGDGGLEELLLLGGDLADGVDLLDTVLAEGDRAGEEGGALVLVEGRLDVGALLDALLAVEGLEERVGEDGGGVGHGEGGGAGAVLGLDDLVTAELDAVDELLVLLALGDGVAAVGLREERHDGDTRVATDDGDDGLGGLLARDAREEGGGTGDVEGGDAVELLRVVDAGLLEDLGDDGHGGVDGVGDDEEVGVGGDLGGLLGEVADDGGVGVEEVVTGHAGLAGHAGGDDDDLDVLERLTELVGLVSGGGGRGVDVRDVGGDTGSEAHIVEAEVGHEGILLEKQREGLSNTARGTEHGDGAVGRGRGGEEAGRGGLSRTESLTSEHGETRKMRSRRRDGGR
ncbi:hypothetical protein L1887_56963 [Cichorium endivia]|nr:hypothetical protein L1887_56963 [Cichorium endivia]